MNQEFDLKASLVEDFKLYGWGDTAAGELAEIEIDMREKSLLREDFAQRPLPDLDRRN